jgi:hypothetical protein
LASDTQITMRALGCVGNQLSTVVAADERRRGAALGDEALQRGDCPAPFKSQNMAPGRWAAVSTQRRRQTPPVSTDSQQARALTRYFGRDRGLKLA